MVSIFNADPKQADKKFVMGKTLGKGSFGKVKEAVHIVTGQKLAIKVLDKEKIAKKGDEIRVDREMKILKTMHHPNIIQLYEVPFYLPRSLNRINHCSSSWKTLLGESSATISSRKESYQKRRASSISDN